MPKKKSDELLRSINEVDREFFPTRETQPGAESRERPSDFGKRLAKQLIQRAEQRLEQQRG
jgi:hypothetical protein